MTESYDQPLVAMDALAVRYRDERLEFGVAVRENAPHAGVEAIPGVLLLSGEHGAGPVLRAMRTKAGIPDDDVRLTRQLGWFDGTMRDPRSATISLASLVFLRAEARDGQLRWHPLDSVPHLPFDHAQIVEAARVRLGEVLWRDWAVTRALLGEKFTSGMALALGAALGAEPFDRPNFRRWLEGTGVVRVTTDTTGVKIRGRTTVWEWKD
ncbi:hypothetical protein C5E06_09305 [Pseudoclavibacter sp. RFBI5]|uniref:NUDIX hydrolase n=1 Tax=Pseudoclavibacter sp. RFBI5 TaxID=2080578 RepID=UPI000CE7A19D|nr:NUDIX hydrolase [Pseudoclavibacter sp. RFBI5]PPG02644.1 hypothetical protein C5E06_09305 [Pseudoclavibacter sp. RFBI5]